MGYSVLFKESVSIVGAQGAGLFYWESLNSILLVILLPISHPAVVLFKPRVVVVERVPNLVHLTLNPILCLMYLLGPVLIDQIRGVETLIQHIYRLLESLGVHCIAQPQPYLLLNNLVDRHHIHQNLLDLID